MWASGGEFGLADEDDLDPFLRQLVDDVEGFEHIATQAAEFSHQEQVAILEFVDEFGDPPLGLIFPRRDFNLNEIINQKLLLLGILQQQVSLLV